MKPKKVLHIIPGFGRGISSTVRNLVNSIDTKKVIIDVAGFSRYSDDFCNEINKKEGKVFTLKKIRIRSLNTNIKEYYSILKNNGEYDVIHIHLIGYKGLYFSLLSKIYGSKRVILHGHASDDKNSQLWYNKLKMIGSRIITQLAADELASCSRISSEYLFGKSVVNKCKVMHIPNSVNVNKFSLQLPNDKISDLKNELGIPHKSLVIGHIGQFIYQKNHIFMVKIIKRMKEYNIPFIWIFIGDGPDQLKIIELIKKEKCEDVTLFLGRRENVHEILQVMDVSILPSHFEGLPTVAVEAQAAGVPSVISSTVTDEVDINAGLVKYLSLDATEDIWINSIIEMSRVEKPDRQKVINLMFKRGFTTEAAAKLYELYIWNKILHHDLGDEIQYELF
ncbi:hypothetical protein CHN50_17270 [Priestia aryabhattai]|nr:hypothetical protein CHN50_17270 [Priestia aryabhattai]